MKFLHKNSSGFTLIELIIVITIVMILLGISLFPYGYYMQRAYTERAADNISQEWILAHKAIRSGIEFDSIANTHASLFFVFKKGSKEIDSYLLSGTTLPDINLLPTDPNILKKYKTLSMESGVEIIDFSGSIKNSGTSIGYIITPPGGDGVFFTGSTSQYLTGATIIVGYPGAPISTGRSREILLRTYLK
ncbi:prepilin-type N-terminal cleavage/methylation domain-containing protein [Candidatus Gracilibacteria bacterium]|nr:prepilin-type N-terminal cleavage/methylation domain-containing protein [Candidatus Gracilibacteria bacterium]